MNFDEMFPSRFLKASDLNGPTRLKIEAIRREEIGDESKYVVTFVGHEKALVLNKTNAKTIAKMYGRDTDNWIGRWITLIATQVDFRGEMVDAVRVKFEPPKPRLAPKPASPPPMPEPQLDAANYELVNEG